MIVSTLAASALANGLVIGLVPPVVDGIKPQLKDRLGDADALDWFGRIFYLAWLPAMPLAGWLLDVAPDREILLFAGLIPLILGFAWLAVARTAVSLLSCALLLGVGYSTVTTTTVRAMTVAFFPTEIADYPLNTASLNFGFVAVGLGALLGPWIVAAILQWCGPRQGLLYLSIAMLGPAILTALCTVPSPDATTPASADVLTHPPIALIAAVLLIYFAIENCLEFWPEAYLKEIGYTAGGAKIGVHVFWFAFIFSRVASAWWLYENANPHHPSYAFGFTVVCFILSAFILGNLAGGYEFGSGSFGFWLLGVCYGPLLPGILGSAFDLFADAGGLPSWTLGLLLALSGLDTLFARPLLAFLAKDHSARYVMRGPAILALVAVLLLMGLAFVRT